MSESFESGDVCCPPACFELKVSVNNMMIMLEAVYFEADKNEN